MSSDFTIARRAIVQAAAACAVHALLPACGGTSNGGSNGSSDGGLDGETSSDADAGGFRSDAGTATDAALSSPDGGANPQPVPGGTLAQTTVTVAAMSSGTVGPSFVGLSYGKSVVSESPHLLTGTNAPLIALFKLLSRSSSGSNPPVLRIGGTQVDESVWTASGAGGVSGQVAPADVDALAAFVAATGWQCLYAINLGGSAPGWPYPTTTTLAAEEVAYVYSAFAKAGAKLLGIEIGNECDQYAHKANPYAGQTWTLATFETLWSSYRSAILAGTPSAVITGPASGNNETAWTVPFGSWATSSNISLLTQHYYRGNASGATAAELIAYPDTTLEEYLTALSVCAEGIGVPLRISETNSFNSAGSEGTVGVSDAYASTLWVIDHMFTCALGGSSGVNMSGDSNQATGYQPISDAGGAAASVNPEYYGILFFALGGPGTLLATTVSAESLNVSAYTVKNSAGGLSLFIVNKDLTNNLAVAVTLPQVVTSCSLLELTQLTAGSSGPSLAATSGVTIQGATVGLDGSFAPSAPYTVTSGGTRVNCYVPSLSAVLLQMA